MRRNLYLISLLTLFISVLAACGNNETESNVTTKKTSNNKNTSIADNSFYEEFNGKIEHIHGLGYAGNQNAIFFAAHDGLKVLENGKWFRTKEFNNDYMGFNAVEKGFYTSGHPGKGVNLENPFGLSRSFDSGETLETLGLQGESDFHAMGVGYKNHVVYVLNGQKNSKMDAGLYVTEDDGETWNRIKALNLGEKVFSIAIHPTDSEQVAVASDEGIFLSNDGGENFLLITSNQQGTSVFFSNDTLWYGTYGNEPVLVKRSLSDGSEDEIALPKMKQDAVMYLAQNPQNENEVVFTTFNGDVYFTTDGTNSWNRIVAGGEIK